MSFPKYPKYKPSGVEWLGDAPEHWELTKIKYVAAIVGGGTPSRDIPDYWNGTVPWVSPKDMKAERITEAEECITEKGLQNSSTSLVPAGRVLMVIRSGILQHTLPVAINERPVALNQDLKAFTFDESHCLGKFFFRWVQGLNDCLLLAWASEGATVESMNQTLLRDSVIPLPHIDEQTAIAAFLDRETGKIDELVAEQRRLMELLKEKRQAVISHAVTKGLNPQAPLKPSGIQWLGDVPEHWDVMPMKHFTTTKTGFAFSSDLFTDEGTPVLRIGDITTVGTVDFANAKYLPSEFSERHPDVLVRRDDIVMAMTGATIGKAARYRSDEPALLNQRVCVFRAIGDIQQSFLWQIFQTSFYAEYLAVTAFGGAQPNISDRELVALSVPVPPIDEMKTIVSYLDAETAKLDALTAEAERAIELLQERRTALISAAVTGKIDVRNFAPKEVAS